MFAIGDDEWAGVSKLIEEMGELHQVLGKLLGSRGQTNHWSGDLRAKLVEELGDTLGALAFFAEKNLTVQEQELTLAQADMKLLKFREWQAEDPALPDV